MKDIALMRIDHDFEHALDFPDRSPFCGDFLKHVVHPEVLHIVDDGIAEFFFALKVEVKATLSQFRRFENLRERRIVEPVLSEQLGRSPDDALAGEPAFFQRSRYRPLFQRKPTSRFLVQL